MSVTRILVVDDDHDTANCLALLLQYWGYEAFVAYGGEEALALAHHFRPEIVLLDFLMPHMNGIELVWRLRQIPGMAKAFLVCITGWTKASTRDELVNAGCDHHIIKPGDIDELHHLLAVHAIPG